MTFPISYAKFAAASSGNQKMSDTGAYAGGEGALGARAPPSPHLGKKFRSEMPKRGEKVPPIYVGEKRKREKKEKNSKRKGTKLKK